MGRCDKASKEMSPLYSQLIIHLTLLGLGNHQCVSHLLQSVEMATLPNVSRFVHFQNGGFPGLLEKPPKMPEQSLTVIGEILTPMPDKAEEVL